MKRIVTISREFGSGGRSIGKKVAQELGFAYYDKELIEKVAESTGLHKDYVKEHGEYGSRGNKFAYSFFGWGGESSVDDFLWTTQRNIILELAEKGNCVIVGRCSDYILRDREDSLHVFVYGDPKKRAERVVELYGKTDQPMEKRLAEKDKKRGVNYNYYTDRKWGQPSNYHLCLNSLEIGLDKCADLIVQLAKN